MGVFDHFPYTNFHELNLEWILLALQEIQQTMRDFVSLNAIKYADPIQWDITRQYEKNTIVIDPLTGTAYISVRPVPSGANITDTDYWTVVFDLGQFVVKMAQNLAHVYEPETTLTATVASSYNDWIIWGDVLYRNINPAGIIPGDQYVVGSNIAQFNIEDVIGHVQDLNTADKSNLVAAINEVLQTLADTTGDLNDLNTIDKSNLVAAINEELDYLKSIAVNVVFEGLDNTGSKDISSDLQTLINSYKILYFPSGIYRIDSPITVNSSNILFGDGETSILHSNCGNNTSVVSANSKNGIEILRLKVECSSYDNTKQAISFSGCNDVKIHDCTFIDFGAGITFNNSSNNEIAFNKAYSCGIGVLVQGSVHSDSSNSNNKVHDNFIDTTVVETGILVRYGIYNDVFNNTSISTKKMGIAISYSQYTTVRNNSTFNTIPEGINVQDCSYCTIIDNNVAYNSSDPGYGTDFGIDFGISLWGTHDDGFTNACTVKGNRIINSYKAGIAIWGECASCIVTENETINCAALASGDGATASMIAGQTTGMAGQGIPYATVFKNNVITGSQAAYSIQSMNGLSNSTSFFNNIVDKDISSEENSDLIGYNNLDVLKSQVFSTNGASGTLFYCKNGNSIEFNAYVEISGATDFPLIPLPYPVATYLRAISVDANKTPGGTPSSYCAIITTNSEVAITNSDGTIPSDGNLYLYGSYKYR